MTADEMARIHAAAFAPERGWTAAEFSDLIAQPHTRLFSRPHGIALTRTLAGETELLTLAVDPRHQGNGVARALLQAWLMHVRDTAQTAFLEVAADNAAARHLYTSLGFAQAGRRAGYYARGPNAAVDALVMVRRP